MVEFMELESLVVVFVVGCAAWPDLTYARPKLELGIILLTS
jgi:hypothetical protein